MHPFYQQQNPLLVRRATEPVTLAPTASMIDPNLESHRINVHHQHQHQHQHQQQRQHQHQHLTNGYSQIQLQMQNTIPVPNHQNQNNGHCQAFQPNHNHNPNASPERALPSINVDENSIDDAYVQFILYCNPSVPREVDTTELRKGFRAPPKSDTKTFSPFILYGLIAKLETKEIKTWTELVLKLGVEPPDTTKNQSTQKVQQYAVRLKRWLRAFHVDAFFNYLQNKSSAYFTERPTSLESLVEREGIPPEEDLAVRALLPEWRPKRGRRKAEDIEAEVETNASNKKQQTRSSSADFASMFEESYSAAAPSTAMSWSAHPSQNDPWAAAQVAIAPKTPSTGQTPTPDQLGSQSMPQQMRWRFTNNETPSSPYPQSAITPGHSFTTSPPFDAPASAHPSTASKSPSRARRRHGPAVSSAWPSTTSTASGKLRGRPPSNRSVQDGPFSTFPANPNGKESQTNNVGAPSHSSPTPSRDVTPAAQQNMVFVQTPAMSNASVPKKPSKLQLQVPEHSGAPVRLATPPRVLINGESNNRQSSHGHERRSSNDFFYQIDEGSDEDGGDDADEEEGVDWKKRALTLKRKLLEKDEELRAMKRRVLDAVM